MSKVSMLQHILKLNMTHKCRIFDRYSVFKVTVIVTMTHIQQINSVTCVHIYCCF